MADDALGCFQSLLDTVPTWLAELQHILQGAAEKQEEILSANKPSDSGQVSRPTPSKSSSLRSRRSAVDGFEDCRAADQGPIRPALRHLTNSDALRLSQRKRKTASIISDESGPPRFRAKYPAVVYYDGDTQKRFETLVRAVGSSRNAIRKGKMSAKVDSLSRSSSVCSESGGSDEEELCKPEGKTGYRPMRPTGFPAFGRNDDTQAFDRVDGRLEKAQGLCERAAHQVLRDGDCTQEVSQARDHFTEALRMATAEIPALERKAKKATERRRRSAERRQLEEEVEEQKKANDLALQRILGPNNPTSAPAAAPITSRFTNDEVTLEVDDLEVDSESESSDGEEFNITSLPSFGKFSAMRNARLGSPVVRL